MISFQEAKNMVRNGVQSLQPLTVPLQQAAGLVLAKDMVAPIDIPSFAQSSMDGYAFCFQDYQTFNRLLIQGIVPAGSNATMLQQPQQAVRIFTGAPVPQGADTVVMQEKTTVEGNDLIIGDDALKRGDNVRPKGSEIKAGKLALKEGTFLSPAAIGFLASLGMTEVVVYPKPSVTIIVTGNELQQPGQPLHYGQVYESNSFTLKAALHQLHIMDVCITRVGDHVNHIQEALEQALLNSDLVLLTGGVSVGDYDYVPQAMAACGVTPLFHKVKQKPGKPLFFGKKEDKVLFGLPGNPSSVLTCFYEYVVPALEKLTLRRELLQTKYLPLSGSVSKKPGLTHLLKGRFEENRVMPLDAQESFRLSSFATANCLICLEENGSEYHAGETVEVHLLPV